MKKLLCSILLMAISLASCRPGGSGANTGAEALPANQPKHGCVNINNATEVQLMELPGIGSVKAKAIIEYRERHGPFRRAEEIIIIDGFSERIYRKLADMICVE